MMTPDDACFCDLAPLYALNALDEEELRLMDAELAQHPELLAELAGLESIVGVLAYGAPPVEMSPNLKHRLFDRLELGSPPEAASAQFPSLFAIRSEDFVWQDYSIPGVQVAILHQDLVKREVTGVLRAAAGVQYPLHCHAIGEDLLMLEGDLKVGSVTYYAGDYLRSEAGSAHAPVTESGCMFFFRTSMDDTYLPSGSH